MSLQVPSRPGFSNLRFGTRSKLPSPTSPATDSAFAMGIYAGALVNDAYVTTAAVNVGSTIGSAIGGADSR